MTTSAPAPETAYIGVIRCRCGDTMEVMDAEASPDGICYTVECQGCQEIGGYNSSSLATFGAVDTLELLGN